MSSDTTRGACRVHLAGVAAGFALLGDSALYAVLPVAGKSLGLSLTEVGVLLSVNRVTRLLINEPAGVLVKKAGPRSMLALALGLAAATTFASGRLAGAFAAFVAVRIVWTFAWSLIRHAANTAVLEAEPGRRGQLLGTFRSLSRAGSLVAVVAGAWLAEKVGFERSYDWLALATLPGIAVALFLPVSSRAPAVPSVERSEPGAPPSGGERHEASAARFTAYALGCMAVHATGSSLLLATASLTVAALAKDDTVVPLLGALTIGVGTLGGLATGARWVGEIGAGPIAGSLVDRAGGRATVVVSGLASAALLGACALASEPATFALAAAGAFLALAGLMAALDALAAHEASRARERGVAWLGRYFVAADAGSAVGPFAGPALAESVGLAHLHAVGAGVAFGVASIALATTRRRDR